MNWNADVRSVDSNLIPKPECAWNLPDLDKIPKNGINVMSAFVGSDNKRMGVSPTLIMCAPNIYMTVKRAIKSSNMIVSTTGTSSLTIDRGTLNPLADEDIRVVKNHNLTDDYWIMIDTSKFMNPFVYLDRQALEYSSQTNPDSDDVFMRRTFKYGVYARYGFIPGLWYTALAGDGTT